MNTFAVLGDAVRWRLVELLSLGEQSAGTLTDIARDEFGISQPAVSQHLRVLREGGLATVRRDGTRRLYTLDPAPLEAAAAELARLRTPARQRLDALHTEISRGVRTRRHTPPAAAGTASLQGKDAS